jgi:hypothetical protein
MYKLTKGSSIIRTTDSACIPADGGNSDYQAYLNWVSEGNTPDPAFTAEELAQQALDAIAAQKDHADLVAAKAYTKLNALKNMSPEEIQTWVTANVNTLAQAKDAIMTLAVGMSVLARRM